MRVLGHTHTHTHVHTRSHMTHRRCAWDHHTAALHFYLLRFGGRHEADHAYLPQPSLDRKYTQFDEACVRSLEEQLRREKRARSPTPGAGRGRSTARRTGGAGPSASRGRGQGRGRGRSRTHAPRRGRSTARNPSRQKCLPKNDLGDLARRLGITRSRYEKCAKRAAGKGRAKHRHHLPPKLPKGTLSSVSTDGVGLRLTFKLPRECPPRKPLPDRKAARGQKAALPADPLPAPEECIIITLDPGRSRLIAACIQRSPHSRDMAGNLPPGVHDAKPLYFHYTRHQWRHDIGVKQHQRAARQRIEGGSQAVRDAVAAVAAAGGLKTTHLPQWITRLRAARQHHDALFNEYVVSPWIRDGRAADGWWAHQRMQAFSRRRSVLDRKANELIRYGSQCMHTPHMHAPSID